MKRAKQIDSPSPLQTAIKIQINMNDPAVEFHHQTAMTDEGDGGISSGCGDAIGFKWCCRCETPSGC